MNKYNYQFERNIALVKAIHKCNATLKDLNKTYSKDPICCQFTEDILQTLEKNINLLYKDLAQVKFEIQKEESAKCNNLDEFIKMVFDHK